MTKYEMKLGAKLDIPSAPELRQVLHSEFAEWFQEMNRGVDWLQFSGSANVAADGTLTLGGSSDPMSAGNLGPRDGFVWSMKRLAVVGLAPADAVTIYNGHPAPSAYIASSAAGGVDTDAWVLYPGDSVLVTGTGLVAGTQVTVTGQVKQVPVAAIWKIGW